MDIAQIIGLPLLPVALLELYLGFLLLRENPRNSPVNKATAVCVLSSALWSLSAGLMYLRLSQGETFVLFARLSWVGWFTVPSALQSVLFLQDEQSRTARRLGWTLYPFWTAVLALCLFTDLVVTDRYQPLPYVNSPGPLEMPLRALGGLLAFWLIFEIFRLRRRATGYRRDQLSYYLYGTALFGTGGAVVGGFLQLFTGNGLEPSLSAYFSLPWTVMIFYAVTRYRLFEVRDILSRTIGIVLLWSVITVLHLMVTRLIEPSVGHSASIALSFALIGAILFGTQLNARVQSLTQRILLQHRYDYQKVLKESMNAVMTILDLPMLLEFITERIRTSLGTEAVYLYWHENECLIRLHGHGPLVDSGTEQQLCGPLLHILGVEPGPLLRNDPDMIPALDAELERLDIEIALPLMTKGAFRGVLLLGRKSNGWPFARTDLDLLETLAGHLTTAIENARLYDEVRSAQASLSESEQKFRTLAQTLPAAVFILDREGLRYVNPAAAEISGYSENELLRLDFLTLIHPDHRQLVAQRSASRLQGGQETTQYEFKAIRKDGAERWVLATLGTIEFEHAPAVIATVLDITDRKAAEEERIRLREENARHAEARADEEARHRQEKEKILRDLHDGIGGVTTNISLLAEMAGGSSALPDIKRALSTISTLAREGLADIRRFLFSLDPRDLSWTSLIAELRSLGTGMIEPHGIILTVRSHLDRHDIPPGSLFCLNLFRIYKEALVNIVKHARASMVTVTIEIDQSGLQLTVEDNGVGIGPDAGTGRGLSNMRSRSAELDGTFTITHEQGTTVRVVLPLTAEPAAVRQLERRRA